MSRFEAAREAALRFGVPLDEDPKEYPPERLLMASSDAEAWCRDAPPEQTLGYMVNARRRLEGYICHLTDIIDTMTRALELAADDARCSRCAKLGTEGCRAYDAYPRSIRRDTEEAPPPDGDGHPDPPDGCDAEREQDCTQLYPTVPIRIRRTGAARRGRTKSGFLSRRTSRSRPGCA